MRSQTEFNMNTSIALGLAIALRLMVGLWPHSGAGIPPMYGDFEAQRHWMEVTTALPLGHWYKNTTENDLQYWGLDYPPLTAYVSYFFGLIGKAICPEVVEFYDSRGHEGVTGKIFMRSTVLICDILVFIPAAVMVYRLMLNTLQDWKVIRDGQILFLTSCVLVPGLLLIDHGHFQYNGVCLGLALLGSLFVLKEHEILGSIFFCLSLNFKQMSLYYSPVFFFFLLRKCWGEGTINKKVLRLAKLGLTVISTFAVMWYPFCAYPHPDETCISSMLQVLHRQFPFSRGIFEDKVANIWYAASVVVDVRQFLSGPQLVLCSLSLTLLLLAPTCWMLFTRPTNACGMMLALMNSSLAFFLASYQVHEKSILLALLPAAFLAPHSPLLVAWLQCLGCFTMFPLLQKDRLVIPYAACMAIYCCLVYGMSLWLPSDSDIPAMQPHAKRVDQRRGQINRSNNSMNITTRLESVYNSFYLKHIFVAVSVTCMVVLHGLEALVDPPERYPHLYPALFSIFGAANFCAAYVLGVCWMYMYGSSESGSNKNYCSRSGDGIGCGKFSGGGESGNRSAADSTTESSPRTNLDESQRSPQPMQYQGKSGNSPKGPQYYRNSSKMEKKPLHKKKD